MLMITIREKPNERNPMRALALLICLVCLNANAGEVSAPQIVVEKYFEYFNDKDRDALNATTGQPFIFSINGHITRWDNYGDAVDFDGLRKSGWSYSRIHNNELVYADDISAMVDINFSRYNTSDEPISTTNVVYILVKRDGVWKLKSGFANGSLTLGK